MSDIREQIEAAIESARTQATKGYEFGGSFIKVGDAVDAVLEVVSPVCPSTVSELKPTETIDSSVSPVCQHIGIAHWPSLTAEDCPSCQGDREARPTVTITADLEWNVAQVTELDGKDWPEGDLLGVWELVRGDREGSSDESS